MNSKSVLPALAGRDSESIDLSIAIVSYNTSQLLIACIESVIAETLDSSIEIIVVDNDSADDSVSRASEVDSRVSVIANTENRGFASAVNQAIAVARGEYFLMLNPDSRVFENALDRCIDFIKSAGEKTAITCNVVGEDGLPHRVVRGPGFTDLRVQLITNLRLERFFAGSDFMRRDRWLIA